MKRGFLFFSIALFAGWIAGAQALGVGEIEVNSHLNQRLSAEIPLVETGELGPEEVLVSLGTPEDFERAGVERFFYLTDMRFEAFSDGRGLRIRITSRQPVTEPYLNFIVEVLWPKGRMLKEFTILLDPPTYQAGISAPTAVEPAPATVTSPSQSAASEDTAQTAYLPETTSDTTTTTGMGRTSPPDVPGDGVLTTGQTLWRIAERYRPANDIKLNQYMLAIQQTNPEAFINHNINLMKAGYRLKMPDADAARQTSAAEAAAQVAEQTASWRNEEPATAADTEAVAVEEVAASDDPGSTPVEAAEPDASLAAQMDATPSSAAPRSAEDTAPKGTVGRLEIQADADSSGAAESPAANVSEAGLREEKDRLEREIQELGYQSDREKELASQQIAERDRKLEVKDQQLADLTAKLEAANQKLAERVGQTSPNQSQSATPWWQSTTMMIGAGLILVLVLVAALLLARRRQQAAQDAAFMETVVETQARDGRVDPSVARPVPTALAPAAALAVTAAAAAPARDADTFDFLDDLARDNDELTRSSPAEPETGAGESPARQTGDVIGEADIYAAYGRYPHAIGLLLGALEEDPDRHDVRLKLLEVAVTANDGETFDKHIRELVNRCDDQDILLAARELEESFAGASEEDDDLLGDEAGESVPLVEDGDKLAIDDLLADPESDKEAEEFSLEIEESEGDAGFSSPGESTSALQTPSAVTTGPHGELAQSLPGEPSDFQPDDVSNLDDDYTAIASDDVPSSRTDVLGGDLGIEFDADEPAMAAAPAGDDQKREKAQLIDDLDDDLDLDDLLADLDEPSVAPGVSAEAVTDRPSTPEDFQFKRVDDVPLLDTAESLSEDMNLDNDQGLEDLDDLLASLDEVEEGSAADPATAPRSAEILSFTRPKMDGGVRSGKAFEDDLESDAADDDDGFDFGDSEDAAETKLDLAQAYIEMGDAEGAQDILNEVLSEGNQAQQELARSLLDSLAS